MNQAIHPQQVAQQIAALQVYIDEPQQPDPQQPNDQPQQTILLVHGWPDTYRVWDAQIPALSQQYRCIRVTLPNYALSATPDKSPRFYSIQQVAEMLDQVVDTYSPDQPVILLIHDWGCVFGYQFYRNHPDKISKIIALDIGDALSKSHIKSLKAYQLAMLATYQFNLALAWRMPEAAGNKLTQWFAKGLKQPTPVDPVHRGMNYPYYQAWFKALSQPIKPFHLVPDCPILFVYATRKPFMFHSNDWLQRLQAKSGNQVTGMRTGHWIMREQPEQFNQLVLDWLSPTHSA